MHSDIMVHEYSNTQECQLLDYVQTDMYTHWTYAKITNIYHKL